MTNSSGEATCLIDGTAVMAGPGDCVEVSLGQAHRIVNAEDEPLVAHARQPRRWAA